MSFLTVEMTHERCTSCGARCSTQLENTEGNGGQPWPLCSGCDDDGTNKVRDAAFKGDIADAIQVARAAGVRLISDFSPREQAAFACKVFDKGRGDRARAMQILCEAFHVLRGVPGVRPYDRGKLMQWRKRGEASSATIAVASFVLSLGHTQPKFHLGDSFPNWDSHNREAFIGWAENPFWP